MGSGDDWEEEKTEDEVEKEKEKEEWEGIRINRGRSDGEEWAGEGKIDEEEKMKDNEGDVRDKAEDDNEHELLASAYALSLRGLQDYRPRHVTNFSPKNSHMQFTFNMQAPSCLSWPRTFVSTSS